MGGGRCLAVAVAAALWCAPAPAWAQFGNAKGGASLHMDTRYAEVEQPGGVAHERQAGIALSLRAMAGMGPPVLYAAGLDYYLGARLEGAFVYEVDLYPIGVGVLITHDIMFGVRGGVGLSGVTGRVPLAVQVPVEVMLELDLFSRLRLASWTRASWVFHDARADGAEHARFADELSGAVALRLGKRYRRRHQRMSGGNGYYLAATYQEQAGARIIGGAFGYSINFGGGRL